MNDIRTRFQAAPWFKDNFTTENVSCIIGGAGGIGSWLSVFLARIGIPITIFDDDVLEIHNFGGQCFTRPFLGMEKVRALRNLVDDFTAGDRARFSIHTDRISEGTYLPPEYIYISAFDNMTARKDMFSIWCEKVAQAEEEEKSKYLFVDGRLLSEQLQIYCVNHTNMTRYGEQCLPSDESIPDAVCTLKQTSHVAAIIGGLMTSFITNHLTNMFQGAGTRFVPFYYEMYLPVVLTNLE